MIFITTRSTRRYLGDRVAVMGSRPGRIKKFYRRFSPTARSGAVRRSRATTELRNHIWEELRPSVVMQ